MFYRKPTLLDKILGKIGYIHVSIAEEVELERKTLHVLTLIHEADKGETLSILILKRILKEDNLPTNLQVTVEQYLKEKAV